MVAASYKSLIWKYQACSQPVRDYFYGLEDLLKDQYQYQIAIAFLFLKLEEAHHRALYGGAVRLRQVDKNLAEKVVNSQRLDHGKFLVLFENIFGHKISRSALASFNRARKVRNRVVHGKKVKDSEMRAAIEDILDYAEAMNRQMEKEGSFKPFGDMRGFKGRGKSLDTVTSKWLMKGLGFNV